MSFVEQEQIKIGVQNDTAGGVADIMRTMQQLNTGLRGLSNQIRNTFGEAERQASRANQPLRTHQELIRNVSSEIQGMVARYASAGAAFEIARRGMMKWGEVDYQLRKTQFQAGATREELTDLNKSLEVLARNSTFTRDQLHQGFDAFRESANLAFGDARKFYGGVAQGATATQSNITAYSQAVGTMLRTLKIAPSEIGKVNEMMAFATQNLQLNADELDQNFVRMLSNAAEAGISSTQGLAQLLGALGAIRQNLGATGPAVSAFAQRLNNLATPELANRLFGGPMALQNMTNDLARAADPLKRLSDLLRTIPKDEFEALVKGRGAEANVLRVLRNDWEKIASNTAKAAGSMGAFSSGLKVFMAGPKKEFEAFNKEIERAHTLLGQLLVIMTQADVPEGKLIRMLRLISDALEKINEFLSGESKLGKLFAAMPNIPDFAELSNIIRAPFIKPNEAGDERIRESLKGRYGTLVEAQKEVEEFKDSLKETNDELQRKRMLEEGGGGGGIFSPSPMRGGGGGGFVPGTGGMEAPQRGGGGAGPAGGGGGGTSEGLTPPTGASRPVNPSQGGSGTSTTPTVPSQGGSIIGGQRNAAGFNPITATKLGGGLGGDSASRGRGGHQGDDIMAPFGSPVYAFNNGKIEDMGYDNWGTERVRIRHDDGSSSSYLHLAPGSLRNLKKGQRVEGGQQFATSGTANGTPHLHFERRNAQGQLISPRQEAGWGKAPVATPAETYKGNPFGAGNKPVNPSQGGEGTTVKGSWYGSHGQWRDNQDNNMPALKGATNATPGIALPSRSTLGQHFKVRAPNGQEMVVQQTDIGPHARTGRGIDINAAAAEKFGYTPRNFPTDKGFTYSPHTPAPEAGGRGIGGDAIRDLRAEASEPITIQTRYSASDPQFRRTSIRRQVDREVREASWNSFADIGAA